ncbi:MAG: ABC transporter permease [Salibacteraceae bacterium]|nr:ABC transporter permease [Salibacteraceae bacterium]
MNFELFLAKKMIGGRRKRLTGQSSSAIVRIAVAGIAIGMAVMILSVSIVRGFQTEIQQKVIGFGSHLQISLYNPQNTLGVKPMLLEQEFIEPVLAETGVKSIQPYAYKSGIITENGEIQGVMAKGVNQDFDWGFFKQNLLEGNVWHWTEEKANDSIVLSKSVIDKLKLSLGDKITIVFIQDQKERKRRFTIGGIYETGMEQFDGSIFLCDIRHVQKLNNWNEDQVAGFEVILESFDDLDRLDYIINNNISYEFNTLKITDQFIEIFGWLELQDINVFIILTLMVLVSGINMISALLVLILERTNMIGLLKAMGALNASISRIFLYNAIYLVFLGLFWGNLLGIGFGLLQQKFHLIKLDKTSYYIDHVPVLFDPTTIISINIGSLVACFVMLLIPSLIVSRIDPVKTIRFN